MRVLGLDDLGTVLDFLLFAMCFQVASMIQRVDITTAASLKSMQFLETMSKGVGETPKVDEILNTVFSKVQEFQKASKIEVTHPPR